MQQQLSDKNEHCLNCGTAIQHNYCEKCGQATGTGLITFKETIHNFLTITFALEGPLWITIRLLITNPGKLFREYISGRRKAYYKPVAFFILLTAIYLILRASINFDPIENTSASEDVEFLSEISPKYVETTKLMSENINNILFLLVFSIALVFKLFFRKQYNLAEYTSIGFYITGVYTMVKIITMFIGKFALIEVNNFEFGVLLILIFYSCFSLFQKKNIGFIVRYVLVSFFSIILYIIIGVGFFFLIVSLK